MRTQTSLALALGLVTGLGWSMPALAAEPIVPGADASRPPAEGQDTYDQYVAAIQIRILFQIEAGKLAVAKGSTDRVKEYGRQIESDFGGHKDSLAPIAQPLGLAVPTEVDATHRQKLDALNAASGAAFDSLFAKQQGDTLSELINWQREFGDDDRVPALQGFRKNFDRVVQRAFGLLRTMQAADSENPPELDHSKEP